MLVINYGNNYQPAKFCQETDRLNQISRENAREVNHSTTLIIRFAQQNILTISQGLDAFVGSLFLCERALQATKPPNPALHKVKTLETTKIKILQKPELEE